MKRHLLLFALLPLVFVACKTEEPEEEPTALFSYAVNELEVSFTNVSKNAKSYIWSFGDGQSSENENPVHKYEKEGTYKVVLVAKNINKTGSYSQNIIVKSTTPTAAFSYKKENMTITFTNTSTNANSYKWDFGDKNTSTEKNPIHTYSQEGTYTVTLMAKNDAKSATTSQSITLTESTPIASFNYSADNLKVTFTNTSTQAQTYSWDFGDGKTSAEENPIHTFSSSGSYMVVLTAKNITKTNAATKTITISEPSPKASFTYKKQAPLTVVFTNTSTNASSYEWDFGDGKSSKEQNPTHRYTIANSYKVTLVVKNSAGNHAYSTTINVEAPKVFVKGLTYNSVGKSGKYYKSVCKDDDLFSNKWWETDYTPMLNKSNLPYTVSFSKPIEFTGLEGDKYYTIYVYWNDVSNGSGTQILKQKMYTSDIKNYPEKITLLNDNKDTSISVLFEYK